MIKKVLFVTDPWHTLDHAGDTTLRLMEETLKLGHQVFWSEIRELQFDGQVWIHTRQTRQPDHAGKKRPDRRLSPAYFDQIHYRVDPPIDQRYIASLQLLLSASRPRAIINSPDFLLKESEKLAAFSLGLQSLAPRTWLVQKYEDLALLFKNFPRLVLKPLYSAQSKGVVQVAQKNSRKKFQELAQNGPVLVQEFFSAVQTAGELRLWYVDGHLLAHCRKIPKRGTFKIDMDRGASIKLMPLSHSEKSAAKKIGQSLIKHRVRLAAVDLIEGRITDLNFTSPGLLRQIEELTGKNLAGQVMRSLLK